MPNKPSAEKRAKQSKRRAAVNRSRKTEVRSAVRSVEAALASGDKKAAAAALGAAEPQIMRGAAMGVIHKNTGARTVSRLAKRVKQLSG